MVWTTFENSVSYSQDGFKSEWQNAKIPSEQLKSVGPIHFELINLHSLTKCCESFIPWSTQKSLP